MALPLLPTKELKHLDELFDNFTNEEILDFINEWIRVKPAYERLQRAEEKRVGYHKAYQEKKKLILRTVTEMLDPDELERLKKQAEENVAAKEEEE